MAKQKQSKKAKPAKVKTQKPTANGPVSMDTAQAVAAAIAKALPSGAELKPHATRIGIRHAGIVSGRLVAIVVPGKNGTLQVTCPLYGQLKQDYLKHGQYQLQNWPAVEAVAKATALGKAISGAVKSA